MSNSFAALSIALTLALVACQPTAQTTQAPTAKTVRLLQAQTLLPDPASPTQHYPALTKTHASGSVHLENQTLTLTLDLPSLPKDFATQKLDLSSATKLYARVTDSHGKTYAPNGATGDIVDYTEGTITLVFENVIPDPLLFVEVQAKAGTTDIVQADLATVIKHTSSTSPVNTTINFQTTVAAKALKRLLNANPGNPANPDKARAIDLTTLNDLTQLITGASDSGTNTTYLKHPTLVNVNLLADALQTQNPGALTEANYRQNVGATVALTINGLIGTDKVQVQLTDAATGIATNLGNGSPALNLTGATPGSGLKLLVTPFGSPAMTYSYVVSPAILTLTEATTTPVTITATPTLNIASFSPAAGPAGTSVVITGTGFTGATAVSFNGTAATGFVVNSNTQITAVVPTGAADGAITVTNGGTVSSNTNFDAYQRIYVNDNAGGSNNGTSWVNAYTSLQDALGAAGASDEIWIAEGTYKPHANDRSISFVMKENVNIYGGFAGTENVLTDRTVSLTDFVTVLSGDLTGNDNYTTPGVTLDENAYHVLKGANTAVLEGVTIEGGHANGSLPDENVGAGMINNAVSPTLNNINFTHNLSSFAGGAVFNENASPTYTNVNFTDNKSGFAGAVYNSSSTPTFNDVNFTNNSATTDSGGAIYNSTGSPAVFNRVTFSNNSAVINGGALYCAGLSSLNHVTFLSNSAARGGGIYRSFVGAFNRFENVVFSNNSANEGGGIYFYIDSNATLSNVTFSNNSATSGGGIFNNGASQNLKNVLFYNSSQSTQTLNASQGTYEVLTDPFNNSSVPNGADGIPRTADDGLRIKPTANEVINLGAPITGPANPLLDILGLARVGRPEPGAYEFIPVPLGANIIAVDKDATGGANNGTSWSNAYTSLQDALAAATAGKEIWVAAGKNTPTESNGDRALSFVMKDGVKMYGGFAGGETAVSQRSRTNNRVTLSGDLNGNDSYAVTPFTGTAENSLNVVTMNAGAQNIVLDSLTIEGGFDDNNTYPNFSAGAGIRNNTAKFELNNSVITHNSANDAGGVFIGGNGYTPTTPTARITNSFFIGNKSVVSGGGVYIINSGLAIIANCVFSENMTDSRGADIAIRTSADQAELSNLTFSHTSPTEAIFDGSDAGNLISKNLLFWNSIPFSLNGNNSFTGNGNTDAATNPFVNSAVPFNALTGPFTSQDGLRIKDLATADAILGATGGPAKDILIQDRPGPAATGNLTVEAGAYEYTP